MIGLLLIGWIDGEGAAHQSIPRSVIPVNSEVVAMTESEVERFHAKSDNRLALGYYPQVITHARQFAPQLLLAVLDQLESLFEQSSKSEIAVLRRTLNWQMVMQSKPL